MAVRPIDGNALHAVISAWPESIMYKDWVQSAIATAPTLTPNRAADMLTVLQAENNKLQDELKCREAEIARLNEAREIANEKAREYEKKCQELGNFDRLRELAEADKEGRCVVLPCKVFQYDSERIYELEVRNIIYDCGYIAFDKNAIDKSVFLTREAAETALKEREQHE